YEILEDTGFKINNTYQTVFGKIDEINEAQNVLVGYGQGSFVVIKAQKI
ncbi:MAG: SAM-dependent methyltransferase, partial [Bacteroidetes bacterium 4484_276]